jgi:hypothetical protein
MVRHWKKVSYVAAFLFSLTLLGTGWGSMAQAQPSSTQAWSGWVGKVSDSNCGAKHKIADAKKCTLACVQKGAKYALVVGEPAAKVFTLEGHAADFEKLAGAMAKVQGDLNGTTIKVTSVEAFR